MIGGSWRSCGFARVANSREPPTTTGTSLPIFSKRLLYLSLDEPVINGAMLIPLATKQTTFQEASLRTQPYIVLQFVWQKPSHCFSISRYESIVEPSISLSRCNRENRERIIAHIDPIFSKRIDVRILFEGSIFLDALFRSLFTWASSLDSYDRRTETGIESGRPERNLVHYTTLPPKQRRCLMASCSTVILWPWCVGIVDGPFQTEARRERTIPVPIARGFSLSLSPSLALAPTIHSSNPHRVLSLSLSLIFCSLFSSPLLVTPDSLVRSSSLSLLDPHTDAIYLPFSRVSGIHVSSLLRNIPIYPFLLRPRTKLLRSCSLYLPFCLLLSFHSPPSLFFTT